MAGGGKTPARLTSVSDFGRGCGAHRADYFAGAQARSAYPHPAGSPAYENPNFLKIRQPAPLGFHMGMADIMSKDNAFSANFTFLRHDLTDSLVGNFRG